MFVFVFFEKIGSTHRYLKNIGCFSFVMCPLLVPHLPRAFSSSFLLRSLTVLIRQTRQVVRAINQSIFLRCLWINTIEIVVISMVNTYHWQDSRTSALDQTTLINVTKIKKIDCFNINQMLEL